MLSVVESMGNSGPDKRFLLVLVVSVVSAALSGSAFCGIIWRKRRKRKCKHNFVHFLCSFSIDQVSLFGICIHKFQAFKLVLYYNEIPIFTGLRASEEDLEFPLFDFLTISNATDNFSTRNKLGEGGFGQVY